MHRAHIISVLILVGLVALAAGHQPRTAAEFFPIASALNMVEGKGAGLTPELIGAGIRPAHLVRAGNQYVPRTPPVMMGYYWFMVKNYRQAVGRPLDGPDLPKLMWQINFWGALPWVILLYGALIRLGANFRKDGTGNVWGAWAAIAGSLAFGWFGSPSEFLPTAALGIMSAALLMESMQKKSIGKLLASGICSGLAGMWHPCGWLWAVWGLATIFVSLPQGSGAGRSSASIAVFGSGAGFWIVVSCFINAKIFGIPLPVQMIDVQPIDFDTGEYARLIWHDIVGWNGIIWLAPLVVPGMVALVAGYGETDPHGSNRILLGFVMLAMLVWGIADDARIISDIGNVRKEFRVAPVELINGQFAMVQIGRLNEDEDASRYLERLLSRTDIILGNGGRPVGIPTFLGAALFLGIIGWFRISSSRFWNTWMWIGVRWGGFAGLIVSQAPYGSISEMVKYIGMIASDGRVPFLESMLAFSVRLAELWPSGVVRF